MTPPSPAELRKDRKKPNFPLIVFLSAVALIVIFICAYFVLRGEGKKMLPKIPDKHPTSQTTPLRPPSGERASNASLC